MRHRTFQRTSLAGLGTCRQHGAFPATCVPRRAGRAEPVIFAEDCCLRQSVSISGLFSNELGYFPRRWHSSPEGQCAHGRIVSKGTVWIGSPTYPTETPYLNLSIFGRITREWSMRHRTLIAPRRVFAGAIRVTSEVVRARKPQAAVGAGLMAGVVGVKCKAARDTLPRQGAGAGAVGSPRGGVRTCPGGLGRSGRGGFVGRIRSIGNLSKV